MSVTTVASVFITTVMTTHHPYFGKAVRRTLIFSLSHEFLPIDVRLTNIHLATSKRSGITPGITRAPIQLT